MTKMVRIVLAGGSELILPRDQVLKSLINDTPLATDGGPKTYDVPNIWANGDGARFTYERVPKAEP